METLLDPLNDRIVKSVKPPPHKPLARNLMYPDSSMHLNALKMTLIC